MSFREPGPGPDVVPRGLADDIRGRVSAPGPLPARGPADYADPGLDGTPAGREGRALAKREGAGILTVPPPSATRPPQAIDWLAQGFLDARTAGNTPAELPGAFTLPTGNAGVVRSIQLSVADLLATSLLTWRLLYDGAPVPGWSDLSIFPSAAARAELVFPPGETQIPVPSGARVSVQVAVADAGSYRMGAAVHGWHYSRRVEEIWRDLWRV